jgi:hypothetical protein
MSKLHLKILDKEFDVTVSPTFLSEANCPFAMKANRIDKFSSPPSWNLEVGKAVHMIFEGIVKLRMKNMPVDEQAVDSLFKTCVGPLAIPHIGEIVRMVKVFLTDFDINTATIAGIEEEVCLDEKGERTTWDNAYVGGYLDMVQIKGDAARVIDYKTQWNILSREELDKHFQLTFYAVLLRKLYPHIKSFEVGIYYARHGFLAVSSRTPQQLDECEHQIELRIEQLNRLESFEPVAGEHCTICDAISICPLAKDLSDAPLAIITAEQATKAAGRLRVLEIVKKNLNDKLKDYSSEHGEVQSGPTYSYGFVPTSSYKYPVNEIGQKLVQHGFPIEPLLRIDSTGLKKFLGKVKRQNEDAYSDILSVATKVVATKFKGYKAGSNAGDEEETD